MAETRVQVRLDRAGIDSLFTSKDGAAAKVLTRLGITMERTAKRLCPVDTGNLRASLNWSLRYVDRGHLAVILGTHVKYAPYVELGTSRMQARPFLRPALAEALGRG